MASSALNGGAGNAVRYWQKNVNVNNNNNLSIN